MTSSHHLAPSKCTHLLEYGTSNQNCRKEHGLSNRGSKRRFGVARLERFAEVGRLDLHSRQGFFLDLSFNHDKKMILYLLPLSVTMARRSSPRQSLSPRYGFLFLTVLLICIRVSASRSAQRSTLPKWKAPFSSTNRHLPPPSFPKDGPEETIQQTPTDTTRRIGRRRRPRLPQRLYKLRPRFFQGLLDLQRETPPASPDNDLTVLPGASPEQQEQQQQQHSQMIHRAFQIADLNGNGSLDLYETYILTLRAYVWINRQAPIPPPTLAMVTTLFTLCDVNHNQSVELPEFVALVNLLTERALWRMTAFRVLQWILAPLCAEYLVQSCPSPRNFLQHHLPTIIPQAVYTRPVARAMALAFTMAILSKLLWRLVESLLERRLMWKQQQQQQPTH